MKCLDYCRYGRDGCKDGFSSCKLLHPVLCKSSLNHRQCYNSNCTLAHLKGTIRNLEDRRYNGQSQNPASQGNIANSAPIAGNSGMHKYKPYDPQNLGFFSYQQPSRNRRQQEPHPINQRYHQPRNDYSYDVSNFPSTQEAYTEHIPNKNGRGSMSYQNDSFFRNVPVDEVNSKHTTELPTRAPVNQNSSRSPPTANKIPPKSIRHAITAATTTAKGGPHSLTNTVSTQLLMLLNIQGITRDVNSSQYWKFSYLSNLVLTSPNTYLIIALTETWLKPYTTDAQIKINGYNVYRADRKHREHGGALLYVHQDISLSLKLNVMMTTYVKQFSASLLQHIPCSLASTNHVMPQLKVFQTYSPSFKNALIV